MGRKLIVICKFDGEFQRSQHGVQYIGGETYAIEVDEDMTFDAFKTQVVAKFGLSHEEDSHIFIKYHLPHNDATLISLMDDSDMRNFINMYKDSISSEIYIQKLDSGKNKSSVLESQSENDLQPKMLSLWQDTITGVGQMFERVEDFRASLQKYAIAHHMAYTFVKNEPSRVTAKCKAAECKWRIHACQVQNTDVLRIKKFNNSHSCDPGLHQKMHPQASKKLIASLVEDKLKDTPRYRAREIINDVRRDYGISLNYQQAYRGKEIASRAIHGSLEDSFNHIPWLCSKIIETNPGSHAVWETFENDRFKSLFVSFYAQIVGFKNGCRPLLLIDGMFGKEHYKVTILSAVAIDANNQMFPLAFSVVLGETQENWFWFLSNLKIVIGEVEGLTIISDRHKGLVDTVSVVFPNCYHAICVHHLIANLMNSLSGKVRKETKKIIKNLVYASANSLRVEEFDKNMNKIKKISLDAFVWLKDSEPYRWAEIYARGCRFGHLTTNVAESFNGWILEARGFPVIAMVNKIREQLMDLFYIRREESMQWTKALTPYVDKDVRSSVLGALTCRVSPANNFIYEVHDGKIHSINLEKLTCTCRTWHTSKIPCIHVVKVCEETGRSIMPYVYPYFTTEVWRLAYAEVINPVPNNDMPVHVSIDNSNDYREEEWSLDYENVRGSSQLTQVLPPNVRRCPGRPKRKRIESQPVDKRSLCCSRCHEQGHNRATCNKAIREISKGHLMIWREILQKNGCDRAKSFSVENCY